MKVWHVLQHVYALKMLSKAKINRHERMHILWLHSYEDSGLGKLKDREKDRGCQSLGETLMQEASCLLVPCVLSETSSDDKWKHIQ